ncbi:MAG: hypothetical protein QXH80_00870, partial [Candidatus Nanoarchaeia archaeon]
MATKKPDASRALLVIFITVLVAGAGFLVYKVAKTEEGDFTKPTIAVISINGPISLRGDGASAE